MGVLDLEVQRERRVQMLRDAESGRREPAVGLGSPRVLQARGRSGDHQVREAFWHRRRLEDALFTQSVAPVRPFR
jgi:hypothetical protein